MRRNRRLMDYMMRRDGRNPYGSEGGYVVSSRRGRRDRARGIDYAYDRGDYRGGDYEYDTRRGDRTYSQQDMERGRRDYEYGGQYDMARSDYGDMRGRDGHYPMVQGYMPIEAMGRFTGYWGEPEGDYARGGRRDYGYDYDMRGRGRDYGYYDYVGDYGETLSSKELESWKKRLMEEVEDKDKQFFNKETFTQRAKQMGIQMGDKFTEDELCLTTLMMYTDYKKTLGTANMDIYVRLAKDWLEDKDVSVKGGEKLAVYYDNIVEDED